MKRIGLTQRVEVNAKTQEQRDSLDEAWFDLLKKCGILPVPLFNHPGDTSSYVKGLNCDGFILTGGNDLSDIAESNSIAPQRDQFEQELLDYSIKDRLPVLGVCRGLQMLNKYYGGSLIKVESHVAVTHELSVTPDSKLPIHPDEEVNSYHNYGIDQQSLGSDLITVATAPDGTIEAAVHKELPQWGIMWHPERGAQSESNINIIKQLFQ